MLDARTPFNIFPVGLAADEALNHTELHVGDYPEVDIHHMVWPLRSPNLNSIEHLWDALTRAIVSQQPLQEHFRN
ncbi:hypothetical protein TNCV_3030591 [Trichonephila clavipes]|nr:hypothetical protein TNCV_3030591 [Trichonephila clavipes]